MNIMGKSLMKLKKNIKSTKLVKQMMVWVNKLAKSTHLKPIYLLSLLGLVLIGLVTLLFRGKYREGNTTMGALETKKINAVDKMNCAINNSTTLIDRRDMMRDDINHYYDTYMNYLDQDSKFNTNQLMDISGNSNGKI